MGILAPNGLSNTEGRYHVLGWRLASLTGAWASWSLSAAGCSLKWWLLNRRPIREVNKNSSLPRNVLCLPNCPSSALYIFYAWTTFWFRDGVDKSFQSKGEIMLKTLPRCSCIQFRKITLGHVRVGQFNNGKGLGCDSPGSGHVDVTMESWQRLGQSSFSQVPLAINLGG